MKAIVVPTSMNDKIHVAEINHEDLRTVYKLIGCDCVDAVTIYRDMNGSIDCFVDDEGLLNDSAINEYFEIPFALGLSNCHLAGVVVITMSDKYGEWAETDINKVKAVLMGCYKFKERFFNF